MQSLINLARLWGNVWDTFFAVGATKTGGWMEIEIMDARILNTRRQLPDSLVWDSNEFADYAMNGENELHIRRRLQLHTRLQLLRMLIRQNPVRQTAFIPDITYLCSRFACQIIGAHELFISRYSSTRATGYFTTSSMVECIYHLALVLHHSKDEEEHTACVSAFQLALDILLRLSSYKKVANRALEALTCVVRRWGNGRKIGARGDGAESMSLSEALDAPGHRRWCMASGIACEICGDGHSDEISVSPIAPKMEGFIVAVCNPERSSLTSERPIMSPTKASKSPVT
ncbi:hypothetical protein LTR53_001212 [Teratosphaeriaceae sp. CCFEE 6253]|nr:hypothetical protein LTR53_001212 [Teratosphaeriaceae sp. CCFEE 6253]